MEKENSTDEEPVGFPAPKNETEVDDNINVPAKNDLSDNETVGTTIETSEERLEKSPDAHEEDQDTKPSTAEKHKSDHELDEEIIPSSNEHLAVAEMKDTSNVTETKSQVVDELSDNNISSSSAGLPVSDNSVDTHAGEPDIKKEDQEKGNSIKDITPNSTAAATEISGREDDNSIGESDIKKEDQEKGNANSSGSENSTNIHASEPDIKNEKSEVGNVLKDTIVNNNADEGEVLDHVKDKNDTGQSSETTVVDHQSAENVEMKSTDVTHATSSEKDGESSSLEETGDAKAELTENTSASKIFRNLSKGTEERNVSNEKDNKNPSHTTQEKPRWSLLSRRVVKTSHDKNQGNNADPKDEVFLESHELKPIKGRIVLYTKLWCQNCKEARLFLRKRKLRYSEINIDTYPSRQFELEEMTGSSDVPKVFFNQVLIGGLDELNALDESGQLEEKIEYVTNEGPSAKAPLPPLSGEDDVSGRSGVDELAAIVRKMKGSIVVKDRFYKFRRITNCFLGSEAVDFLVEDQVLEREGAIEFARKLVKELFFRHVYEEITFEDGNHLYRFLDQDPVISQCQNIPRGISQLKRQSLKELSRRLRFLLYAILDAYTSEDGKHIAYRTIHGSEEFARYLRIAEEVQRVDLNKTAKEERLAFFINLYNLMTIHAILVWGHPEGALDRRKLFNDFKYVIGGCAYSLSDIYNGILRANQRPPYALAKPFGISDRRFKVALAYPEPLVHFALVTGNRSAPPLRCYSPKTIDRELTEASRDFLQSVGFVPNMDSMTISATKILKWYSVDFGKNEGEVLKHAANYLEVEKTQNLLEVLDSNSFKVVYQPYDWRLNS